MPRISVNQPRDFSAPAIVALFVLLWFMKVLPLDGTRLSQLGVPLVLVAYVVYRVWLEFVRGRRLVSIDAESGRVLIHTTSILLRQKLKTFPLSRFSSVRSYVTPGRFSKNVVELVAVAGGEALLLAWFSPDADKSKLFIPVEVESMKATKLRASISKEAGLSDDGFLGVRWVGKQIEN